MPLVMRPVMEPRATLLILAGWRGVILVEQSTIPIGILLARKLTVAVLIVRIVVIPVTWVLRLCKCRKGWGRRD